MRTKLSTSAMEELARSYVSSHEHIDGFHYTNVRNYINSVYLRVKQAISDIPFGAQIREPLLPYMRKDNNTGMMVTKDGYWYFTIDRVGNVLVVNHIISCTNMTIKANQHMRGQQTSSFNDQFNALKKMPRAQFLTNAEQRKCIVDSIEHAISSSPHILIIKETQIRQLVRECIYELFQNKRMIV